METNRRKEGMIGGAMAGTLAALGYSMFKGHGGHRLNAEIPPRMPHPHGYHGIGIGGGAAAPAA